MDGVVRADCLGAEDVVPEGHGDAKVRCGRAEVVLVMAIP